MKILKLMHKKPKTVSPDDTLQEAARIMKKINAGVLPVIEEGQVIGMVTDRDITIRATARGIDPATASVRDVMTHDAISCFEDEEIHEVGSKMLSNHIGRLPVLSRKNLNLAGIVSLADIISRCGGKKLVEGKGNLRFAIPALVVLAGAGIYASRQARRAA